MTTSSKDFVIDLVYNNQSCSDVILEVGPNKFFLLLPVIKQHAPSLFEEFEKLPNVSLTTLPDAPLDQVLANLTTMLSKPKKTLKITDLAVTKEALDAVLKSMYTSSLEVTSSNHLEIYKISTRFGMKELSEKCIEVLSNSLRVETLLEDYKNAFLVFSPLAQMYFNMLKTHISVLPKDKLLEFVPTLMYETILELITDNGLNCTEDLVYEMVDAWYQYNQNLEQAKLLMSKVNLQTISSHLLLTQLKNSPYFDTNTYVRALEWRESERKQNTQNRTARVFAIGRIDGSYPGFRLMTSADIRKNTFQSLFKEYYDRYDGLYCLDSFPADALCCKDVRLAIETMIGFWLRISEKNTTVGKFVKLRTSRHDTAFTQKMINTITTSNATGSFDHDSNGNQVVDNAGLFINETTMLV